MKTGQAFAVIGAGYGDEGKGLLTDVLASAHTENVVVRSNGGAQAGHTVVAPDGQHHVFHHVGSGALAGVATHLSTYFVAHPMMLLGEIDALNHLGISPRISSDPRTIVTTPFDVMINQALELARGNDRHGSCGLGFGETIERCIHPEFCLTTQDLFRTNLRQRLEDIRSRWLPARLSELGLSGLPDDIAGNLDMAEVIERFIGECEAYLDTVMLWPDSRIAEKGTVIFEGAQGLLLDQDYGAFPHVTRSNTGLKNILTIASEAKLEMIQTIYVTRCYVTRHGAGPLAHETNDLAGITVIDPTNAPNAWQGQLRLAPLDIDVLSEAIRRDIGLAADATVNVDASVAVTCLDQVDDQLTVLVSGNGTLMHRETAAQAIAQEINLPLFGESWGPGREDFVDHACYASGA